MSGMNHKVEAMVIAQAALGAKVRHCCRFWRFTKVRAVILHVERPDGPPDAPPDTCLDGTGPETRTYSTIPNLSWRSTDMTRTAWRTVPRPGFGIC